MSITKSNDKNEKSSIRTGLSQLGVLITYPLVHLIAGCLVLHITSSGVINNIIVRYLQRYIGNIHNKIYNLKMIKKKRHFVIILTNVFFFFFFFFFYFFLLFFFFFFFFFFLIIHIGKQNIALAMVGIYAFFVFTVLDYIVKILSKSDIDDSPTMRVIFFFSYEIFTLFIIIIIKFNIY